MSVWALADLHLPFGNPKKTMEVFGKGWSNYVNRIHEAWTACVKPEDLVLVPGDISWAIKHEDALKDLEWIDQLPGQKLIIRGNHDYWWPSNKKLTELLPPTIHFIHNTAFDWNDITFGGARLWDTQEYSFDEVIDFVDSPYVKKHTQAEWEDMRIEGEKIFERELERLTLSLEKMNQKAKKRVALTHYPPIGKDLKPSRASIILEDFKIDVCVFGHLHNVRENSLHFGNARGVKYVFASADYLRFIPIKVFD